MRISELASATGVGIPTLKFYLREGLLPRGRATAATQAEYEDAHAERVRLIDALTRVAGLPLAKVREVLGAIDMPDDDPVRAIGAAVAALPPYVDAESVDLGPAYEAAGWLGLELDPMFPAAAQLAVAIDGVRAAGLTWDAATARRYADAIAALARAEVAPTRTLPAGDAVSYAVLGTALYEPVLLAMRRLMHQQLATGRIAGEA
ncbi:MAG: MerR family transcriptional regulator [Microbacterium sp.]|uniref:MerR family transcriptional regulator n=1 Tax=Microbacterium sp. TaxID=51671 RepID=UPI0039E35DC2